MSMLEMEVRPLIEQEIERLLEVLDRLNEDPDLEPAGDEEPSLGAPERQAGSWKGIGLAADDRDEDDSDREPCCEDEGAQCDDEGNDSGDREPELSGFNHAWGPCSPISTLFETLRDKS
jgi:hypothetical protein